jgi:hypothetical protein
MLSELAEGGAIPAIPPPHLCYLLTGAGPTTFELGPDCRRLTGLDPLMMRSSRRTPTPCARSSSVTRQLPGPPPI